MEFSLPPLEALGPKSSSRKLFPSNEHASTKEWAPGEIVSSPGLEASKSLCDILGFCACTRAVPRGARGNDLALQPCAS